MPIHREVLEAALRLCRRRGAWHFTADEIVRALPQLNAASVRTHVASRCCVNAPKNHPHKWDYVRRVARGVYEVLPEVRRERRDVSAKSGKVAERRATYVRGRRDTLAHTIHAVVRRDRGTYVAECLEVAVVTQGGSLDELVSNLCEAVELHLEGEDLAALGLAAVPRLSVQYELATTGNGP